MSSAEQDDGMGPSGTPAYDPMKDPNKLNVVY